MIKGDWKILCPPPPVGSWKMPGAPVYFHATVKPRWLTRFLMRHLLQWEWKEGNPLERKNESS